MQEISLLELLKSGAHFGHSTSRWNPKMKQFIYTTRGSIHILDLEKTRRGLTRAAKAAADIAASGGTVLFVGTKRQTRDSVRNAAAACNMPYVSVRWLGGTFTNFKTIQKTVRKLEKLEDLKMSGELEQKYTKKERLLIEREILKLKKLFEGIASMRKLPEAVFVTDVKHDAIAVREATKSGVKVIGIVDTNSSLDGVDYVIPCNDDATKAVDLVATIVAEAIAEGRASAPKAPEPVKTETPAAQAA